MKVFAWNVALSAVFLVLGLAGLEAYLRHTIPAAREGTLFEYTLGSKRYKVMKPRADMRVYGKQVRTNDLGFRDNRAAMPAKQAGEFRVIVLGDSFTFGPGIDYEAVFTSVLQEKLARTHPNVQVINLGVEGYNIVQYEAVLQEVGLRLQPDLILVSLFPVNDFEMDTYDNNHRVAAGDPPPPPAWYESLYVYRAYLHRAETAVTRVVHRLMPASAANAPDVGWETNIAALKQISTVAQARGLPLAVALLPHTRGFETQRALFARVEAYCDAEGLRCLDLLAIFRAKGVHDGALALNAVDAHGNEAYHQLVGEQLAPYLAPLVAGRRPAAQGL
jgi:lysophospholipase L1-like esterase